MVVRLMMHDVPDRWGTNDRTHARGIAQDGQVRPGVVCSVAEYRSGTRRTPCSTGSFTLLGVFDIRGMR